MLADFDSMMGLNMANGRFQSIVYSFWSLDDVFFLCILVLGIHVHRVSQPVKI